MGKSLYPSCAFCGRQADESPAMFVQTLFGNLVCSPCLVKDAKQVETRETVKA
jgi:hypothetical protein